MPHFTPKKNFQTSRNNSQPFKVQRVNNIDEKPIDDYDSMKPELGEEVDNISSYSAESTTSSAFLGVYEWLTMLGKT